MFCKVFASVQPPQRASLHKLRKTWTSVLPADVLANIDARLAPLEAALAPAAPAAYAPVPPAQPPAVTSVQQPAYSAAPYGAAAPAAVPGSAMPHMVQAPAAWQPGFLQPMPGNGTQYVMYGQGAMVQQTQPQFQQQQMQQLLPMQPVLNGFAPPQMQLPQQHQPQYQYMQPLPQQPTAAPQQQQPPQQQLPPPPALPSTGGQQATGGFDILASLLGILPSHLTADSGADASSSAGAVAPAAAPAAARVDDTFPSTSGRAEDIAGTEFDTKFIKVTPALPAALHRLPCFAAFVVVIACGTVYAGLVSWCCRACFQMSLANDVTFAGDTARARLLAAVLGSALHCTPATAAKHNRMPGCCRGLAARARLGRRAMRAIVSANPIANRLLHASSVIASQQGVLLQQWRPLSGSRFMAGGIA